MLNDTEWEVYGLSLDTSSFYIAPPVSENSLRAVVFNVLLNDTRCLTYMYTISTALTVYINVSMMIWKYSIYRVNID